MNGLRSMFGRRKPSLEELKDTLRPTPYAYGVTRVGCTPEVRHIN